LSDRRSTALVDHISEFRDAFRIARRERPFEVDAIVILPDHLHAVFTMPPDDADFSGRWHGSKGISAAR
jgi:putative transposase